MKKLLLALLASLLLLTGCAGYKGRIEKIDPEAVIEKFENKETFFIYAGKDDCDSCAKYRATIYELIDKYDIVVYYMVADNEEKKEFIDSLSYDYFYRLIWTPSSYIVIDGETVDMKEKELTLDQLEQWLNEYGFLQK